MRVEGIVVPMVSPVRGDRIDEEAAARLTESLIRGGIHGLFVAGTTGEGPLLTAEERLCIVRAVRRAAAGRVPVLVGVGGVSTAECCDLADMAAGEGADAVVAMTPYFYGFTQSEIRRHLEAIVAHSRLPVVIYEIPQRTGNHIELGTVAALMQDSRVVCVKDSSGNIGYFERLLRVARPDATVLVGDDALILPAMSAGGHGAVSGLGNAFPRLFAALYRAARQGDLSSAKVLQQRVISAQDAILAETSIIAALKAAMAIRGLPVGDPTPPIAPLTAEARARLESAFRREGLLAQETQPL